MKLAIGNILLCLGVLAFAIQWENWSKPNVIKRIVDAARTDAPANINRQTQQVASQSRRMDGIPQGKQGR